MKRRTIKVNLKLSSLMVLFSVFMVLFITVGYSAMSTTLSINGQLVFRPYSLVRITNAKVDSGGNENTPINFDMDEVFANITLPNLNSRLIYDIDIQNLGNTSMQLHQIISIESTNPMVEYTVSNLSLQDTLTQGQSRSFKITFRYKQGANNSHIGPHNFRIRFLFKNPVLNTNIQVGDRKQYLGKMWRVIAVDTNTIKLLSDVNQFDDRAHCLTGVTSSTFCYWVNNSNKLIYRWSRSNIREYLNNEWLPSVDSRNLYNQKVCNDEAGTPGNGGAIEGEGLQCNTGYVDSKVRLLSKNEFNSLKANSNYHSWLFSSSLGIYRLSNTGVHGFATSFVMPNGNVRDLSYSGDENANHTLPYRAVIVVKRSVLDNSVQVINLANSNMQTDSAGITYIPMTVGNTERINVSFVPENSQSPIIWSSTENSIASVNNGLVTANAPGEVTIKATANNGVFGEVKIRVSRPIVNYVLGQEVRLGNITFNVVGFTDSEVTLLAKYNTLNVMAHCLRTNSNEFCYYESVFDYEHYTWKNSQVNKYLNNEWLQNTGIDPNIVISKTICSGHTTQENSGTLHSPGRTCGGNLVTSKVRLLTMEEFNYVNDNITEKNWLYSQTIGTWALLKPGTSRMRQYTVGNGGYVSQSAYNSRAHNNVRMRPVITIQR